MAHWQGFEKCRQIAFIIIIITSVVPFGSVDALSSSSAVTKRCFGKQTLHLPRGGLLRDVAFLRSISTLWLLLLLLLNLHRIIRHGWSQLMSIFTHAADGSQLKAAVAPPPTMKVITILLILPLVMLTLVLVTLMLVITMTMTMVKLGGWAPRSGCLGLERTLALVREQADGARARRGSAPSPPETQT